MYYDIKAQVYKPTNSVLGTGTDNFTNEHFNCLIMAETYVNSYEAYIFETILKIVSA